jgi:hypothetical protein
MNLGNVVYLVLFVQTVFLAPPVFSKPLGIFYRVSTKSWTTYIFQVLPFFFSRV